MITINKQVDGTLIVVFYNNVWYELECRINQFTLSQFTNYLRENNINILTIEFDISIEDSFQIIYEMLKLSDYINCGEVIIIVG